MSSATTEEIGLVAATGLPATAIGGRLPYAKLASHGNRDLVWEHLPASTPATPRPGVRRAEAYAAAGDRLFVLTEEQVVDGPALAALVAAFQARLTR